MIPLSDGCQASVGTAIALQVASPAYIHDKNHPGGLGTAWVSCGTVPANATASTNRSTSANTQNVRDGQDSRHADLTRASLSSSQGVGTGNNTKSQQENHLS